MADKKKSKKSEITDSKNIRTKKKKKKCLRKRKLLYYLL